MAIPKPILQTDPSITFAASKRKRKEKKTSPTHLEKESEMSPIPLRKSIEFFIKTYQPRAFQGTSSTPLKVPSKEKVGEEAPLLGVNQILNT